MNEIKKVEKIKILEKEFPNLYNTPTIYQVPDIILYFAAVNGLLTINSDGISYVAGMKIV